MTRTIVATYSYPDENDNVLYETVRHEPKSFSQRIPLGNGLYRYKLNGVRRVPYCLPDLLRRKARETVFFVEGEKDVEALRALGFCATTNAQGAGWKWTSDFVACFSEGRRVVFIPDADAPGRKAAGERAALLGGVVDDVRILDLAPEHSDGRDVSDWIAKGHPAGELKAQVESAPRFAAASNAVPSEEVVEPVGPVVLANFLRRRAPSYASTSSSRSTSLPRSVYGSCIRTRSAPRRRPRTLR